MTNTFNSERIAELSAEIAVLKREASKSHADGHKPAYLREIRKLQRAKAALVRECQTAESVAA